MTKERTEGRVDTVAESEPRLSKKIYERELLRLQEELVKMTEWVKDTGRPGRRDLRGA